MAFVERLQCFLADVDTTILRIENMKIADIVIEDSYIAQRFEAYHKEPITVRLANIADDMMHVLKRKRNGELKLPSKNEVVKRLKKRLAYPSAFAIYRAFIETLPKGSFYFKNKHFEFNDVYPYLYVQTYFSGMTTFELVQHFVLDEMQDYTPIQYAVLAQLFTCKRTIIGDVGQALFPYETMSLQALSTIFPRATIHRLTTTYRSSYEIATYAQQFLEEGMLQPIARHSKEVDERFYTTHAEMLQQVHNAISSTAKTTAIICKTSEDAMYISEHLQKPHHVMDGTTTIFETGIIVTTIQYAKGLEFDAVIVPFVDNTRYATKFERGLLYIAVTRAMHELTVLIDAAAPTPLVATV
ncbi:ATP-binding domain-containing protein [Caryophanon tenue]|uniref:UvrD-like helicase C-terminal domain-containing protein n=1 Tax=Caryophanon tenue TaxID=33978 RepID=A0A1C0YHY1_9BACL|nr:ATP-binding domain-containing protein [Caryophanon tenue]OCS86785.1 hypothetical protein A6M13_12575 [Caryophanon tenue]